MKRNLGRDVVWLLLFTLSYMPLLAENKLCDYQIHVSNKTPYIKEAVEITFEAKQVDPSEVMFFELSIPKSDTYEIIFIEKLDDQKGYHDSKATYKYLLFPLRSGTISVAFDFSVSTASDESVEKFYTGNRNEIRPLQKKQYTIDVNPLSFEVKALDEKVDFVGDFTLNASEIKTSLEPYEQLNVAYTLEGKGHAETIDDLYGEINGVEHFVERSGKLEDLYTGSRVIYRYAFLSPESFTLPMIKLHAFSPTKNQYYDLVVPIQHITVKPVDASAYLDSSDSHPSDAFSFEKYSQIFNAILLFSAGFLSAKWIRLEWFRRKKRDKDPLKAKIAETKDEKELLRLLLSQTDTTFRVYIEALEDSLYGDKPSRFSAIKDSLLKR